MLVQERRAQMTSTTNNLSIPNKNTICDQEASCLYALITGRRSVSRRNRASWYFRQLNKLVKCDPIKLIEQDGVISEQKEDKNDSAIETQDDVSISHPPEQVNSDEKDIFLVSMTSSSLSSNDSQADSIDRTATTINQNDSLTSSTSTVSFNTNTDKQQRFLVTPNTRVMYLSKSIATSIILDLSPSVVSVSPQNDCVFLDSMFDALKRVLHLLVKEYEFPSSQADRHYTLGPKVFVSVIAYTPFVVAKNNQVLIQNRRISSLNIDQVLVELWICLNRLIQELHELVTNTCGVNFEYESTKSTGAAFVFAQPVSSGIIRHPGFVLEDIYELGLFSANLMPRLSRLSILIITDGLFASSNNLSTFRLHSIAVSFVSLATESVYPDACFGYTTYTDLMKFVAKSTQGVYISHHELIESSCNLSKTKRIPLMNNPLYKLFSWSLHSATVLDDNKLCTTPRVGQNFSKINASAQTVVEMKPEHIAKLFCIDQPLDVFKQSDVSSSSLDMDGALDIDLMPSQNYHDWRSFKQLSKSLDADFEQVLSCLLREGYLIESIQLKHRETSTIVARLVLYWKHNLHLEQELTAPYWNSADPFDLSDSSNNLILKPFLAPSYGDTHCEVIIHGSYNFLHDFYCDTKGKRRSDYRTLTYQQFEQLILSVKQTYDKLQYFSRFYRDLNLSKVPSFLLHGNSLLFEQPHTQNLTSTIDNVVDKTHQSRDFSDYWQEISQIELRNWKNLMHIHTLRLILEHDQPKHKNVHCQNANGRYTHIQCRRAMSAISSFIKGYASFALLEDSLYIKFIHNKEDDLREIETSATKGFIVIRIKKLLPIVVIYLMFTSGILDSHRVQIVSYIEKQLVDYKLRNTRTSTASSNSALGSPAFVGQGGDNILKSKIIYPSGDSCCVLMRSPLERMLRVYSRNMLNEFLAQNLTHGLPGSCPYSAQQRTNSTLFRSNKSLAGQLQQQDQQQQQHHHHHHQNNQRQHQMNDSGGGGRHNMRSTRPAAAAVLRDQFDEHSMDYNVSLTNNRYNPVFGKYLYGIRVVHTLSNLPLDLIQPIVVNVLAKISAILVNVRIKQGFHIAFNNSGLLNLVAELSMKDYSHEYHSSNCLCQYLLFPPTVTNSGTSRAIALQSSNQSNAPPLSTATTAASLLASTGVSAGSGGGGGGGVAGVSSKPGSLSGSLANSEHSFMRNMQDASSANPAIQAASSDNNQGEVKVIREYWIEQQYGISSQSDSYHKSLANMRYSEIVDHLYTTDTTIFNCLVTYDLLQLLCDKMSPFYELDIAMSMAESRKMSVLSPTSSTASSSNLTEQTSPTLAQLPSNLIEGTTKDGAGSRVPLIELDYQFSIIKFLDYCQFASLDVLLFRDKSDYFEQHIEDLVSGSSNNNNNNKTETRSGSADHQVSSKQQQQQQQQPHAQSLGQTKNMRKMSVDVNNSEVPDHGRREHRYSYDSLNTNFNFTYVNPIYNPSLNHLFLDTLHKRLKQMHDKEMRLSEQDRRQLSDYLRKRKISLELGEDAVSRHDLADDDDDDLNVAGPPPSHQVNHESNRDCTSHSEVVDDLRGKQCGVSNDNYDEHTCTSINWRCFMRKGNQENLMIVLIPASLSDVSKWTNFVQGSNNSAKPTALIEPVEVCPILVFRCSCTMINDQISSFLDDKVNDGTAAAAAAAATAHDFGFSSPTGADLINRAKLNLIEKDIVLHFGRPCKFLDKLRTSNDELDSEILPLDKFSELTHHNTSDEKTLELVHFRAFLRKIKNTVLKSRFSSLNDAYLSELFVHKHDILYYINNVDLDSQKKYHVSSHLKSVADFINSYEDYQDSLPQESALRPCNQLLNSILLQKCGLFINQPMARFNEANPLMKQLHDRKLLFLMRCNYKIELPMLEENLYNSKFLKKFIRWSPQSNNEQPYVATTTTNVAAAAGGASYYQQQQQQNLLAQRNHQAFIVNGSSSANNTTTLLTTATTNNSEPLATMMTSTTTTSGTISCSNGLLASSLGRNGANGARLMEMRSGSIGSVSGSPGNAGCPLSQHSGPDSRHGKVHQMPRISSASMASTATTMNNSHHQHHFAALNLVSPTKDSFFLEAFKNVTCSIDEIMPDYLDCETIGNVSLRHEAHMAEVLKRKGERKESHHYRRVLKSKANYNQSHSAIDQALKRVDSLGRLEHFCLTPLLFSPSWRSKLAPVRDHTIEASSSYHRKRSSDTKLDAGNNQRQLGCVDTGASTDQLPASFWSAMSSGGDLVGGKQHQQQQQQSSGFDSRASYYNHVCSTSGCHSNQRQAGDEDEDEANERWHQMICYNYIKEYEQYIQTLGFNSVQIRYPSGSRLQTSMSSSSGGFVGGNSSSSSHVSPLASTKSTSTRKSSLQVNHTSASATSPATATTANSPAAAADKSKFTTNRRSTNLTTSNRRESLISPSNLSSSSVVSTGFIPISSFASATATAAAATPIATPTQAGTSTGSANMAIISAGSGGTHNTGYLIKFLNSGCLVFKVGFCKPYVYSILYSIEGERFNNSNMKMNMTAFLDELDSIKVTLHLHSFTYDYHLRSMYSYISRRQMNFSPGYHLISFVDDFRKYYQKAPNYARNHVLSGEVSVANLKVDGQQLYNYIVTHNSIYNLDVLEMTNSFLANLTSKFTPGSPDVKQHLDAFIKAQQRQQANGSGQEGDLDANERNHANDYVLIELKREKVRYKDGKDPDIFECGLLITHDYQASNATKNCLVLKYFLLLTNQRDLYPKLVHTDDNMISLGCHRPIRLGVLNQTQQQQQQQQQPALVFDVQRKATGVVVAAAPLKMPHPPAQSSSSSSIKAGGSSSAEVSKSETIIEIMPTTQQQQQQQQAPGSTTTTTTNATDLEDMLHSSEFLSSGELSSGPQSIVSTVNSIQSSTNFTAGGSGIVTGAAAAAGQREVAGALVALEPPLGGGHAARVVVDLRPTLEEGTTDTSVASSVRATPAPIIDSAIVAQERVASPSSKQQMSLMTEEAADALEVEEFAHDSTLKSQKQQHQQQHQADLVHAAVSPVADRTSREHVTPSIASLQSGGSGGGGGSSERDTASGGGGNSSSSMLNRQTVDDDKQEQQQAETAVPRAHRTRDRTICDEEITYLGYFSSDEMDMLKFLQEKTANLRAHLDKIVRTAEVHYRRDYLWHKLMQCHSPSPSSASISNVDHYPSQSMTATVTKSLTSSLTTSATCADQLPLTIDELIQLLQIVDAIDLATLDPNLTTFTTMHINWYMKLLKAFNESRQQSSSNLSGQQQQQPQQQQHRIYTVKASKILLIYIDPKCTTAFILLSINTERGSVELSVLLKDKQESSGGGSKTTTQVDHRLPLARQVSTGSSSAGKQQDQMSSSSTTGSPTAGGGGGGGGGSSNNNSSGMLKLANIELDQECQQLISDFINFCATFMWSTLLT